jgi:hypothetical protein
MGFEQGVVATLEHLLEEFSAYRQYLRELSELQSTCMDTMSQFIQISEAMKYRLETLRRVEQHNDDEASGEG